MSQMCCVIFPSNKETVEMVKRLNDNSLKILKGILFILKF